MQIFKNVRRIALFMLSMVFSMGIIFAQERTVTGKVTGEGEGALPGVNVVVQGTTIGAITDANGAYTIKVPGPGAVLQFSSIGYSTKSVTVGSQSVVDMVLVSDTKALQEVVVTGYTQQKRRDLTGAVGVVETTKLTAIPLGNVSNQLQGRTSGVSVIGSGVPGATSKVRIRGFGSFENNDPLYVVDGVPTQDISSLNPNDVASMTVLKDAGAASIYGSRASNGVIVITTKKGQSGTKVTYDMYYGVQLPGKGPTKDLLDAQEYANLQWLVYKNDGLDGSKYDTTGKQIYEVHPVYGDSRNATPTLPSWAGNTDWYKAITQNAPIQNHDITLSGGNDKAKYFAGLGIFQQKGIIMYTDAKKYTGRFNSEFTFLNDRVKVGENITMAYRVRNGIDAASNNLNEGSPIQQASYRMQPIIPVLWTQPEFVGLTHTYKPGDWGGTGIAARLGQSSNEVAVLTRNKDNIAWSWHLIGSGFVDIKILQGLNFKSTIGGTFDYGYNYSYSFKTYENSENNATNSFNEGANFGDDWFWTNQLTLDKTFGQHKILAVAGYEAVKYGIGRYVSGNASGYFTDDPLFRTLNNGSKVLSANSDLNTPTTLVSILARADYSFMDRYMLSATIRRDGSSRFGADTRYGIFPAFSAGWRISDEPWFKGISFISDLKLRGSYGTMGNQLAVSPQNQFYSYGGSPVYSFYDINGTFTSSVQGFAANRIGNPNAKWETSANTDIGFEGSILNNKVSIKLDWYQRINKDLLYNPELPGTAGVATAPYVNIAQITNKGLDGELSYRDKFGDLGLDATLILTTVKNTIDKIAPPVTFFDYGGGTTRIGAANRNQVGHPMSAFFGYKVIGLFQSAAEVASSPQQDGAAPGFFKYQDTNGDGKITPDDRVFIGSPLPKFQYGFNLGLTYKGFDLTGFLYGVYGNDINNWNAWWIDFWPSFQGQKSKKLLYDSWTPERTNTNVPMATNTSNFSTNTQVVSYYIEKGSYARLRNLQLGYTIPSSLTSKVNIKSLRVYVQGVNLFTITKYSGLDPELGGDDRAYGSDTGNYPIVKQVIFGLNLVF